MSDNSSPKINSTAFALLAINGTLLALMLPLATVVTNDGMSPIAYAFWQTLGAGLTLTLLSWRNLKPRISKRIISYCLISGATGIALPNALAFFVVGKVGPGFTSTLYAFPPIFTLIFALLLNLETASLRRMTGIGFACIGCFWVVWSQLGVISSEALYWYFIGLAVPIAIAAGNVYRTIAWPKGNAPVALAAGMMLGASAWLLLVIGIERIELVPTDLKLDTYGTLCLQMGLTALTYLGVFELQKRSNPVFLSQMGCVAALIGLMIGLLFFEERYALGVWVGVSIILLGLWLTNTESNSRSIATLLRQYTRG